MFISFINTRYSLLAHDRKGKWSQPLRTCKALLCLPFQIHPVCTVPVLPAPCSSLSHQAGQAFPYTWAFAHSSLSFWNVLSSTSRLFLLPESVYASPPQRRSHPSSVHSLFSSFPYLFPSFVIIPFYFSLLSMSVSLTTVWVSWWQLNHGTPGPRTRPGPGQ